MTSGPGLKNPCENRCRPRGTRICFPLNPAFRLRRSFFVLRSPLRRRKVSFHTDWVDILSRSLVRHPSRACDNPVPPCGTTQLSPGHSPPQAGAVLGGGFIKPSSPFEGRHIRMSTKPIFVRTGVVPTGLGLYSHSTQDSACPPQFAQKRRESGAPAAAPSWAELSRPYGRDFRSIYSTRKFRI